MVNSQDQGFGIPFLTGLILLAGFGGFIVSKAPFKTSRPPDDGFKISSTLQSQNVPARLWQDPFAAIATHLAKKEDSSSGVEQSTDFAPWITIREDWVSTGSDVIADTRLRADDRLKDLAIEIFDLSKGGAEIVVMPVMVSGSPYAEDAEQRRRRRYAVLSALGSAGYAARDPEHIGYFQMEWPLHLTPETNTYPGACEVYAGVGRIPISTLPVPFEWLVSDDATLRGGATRVPLLVMWLDERLFSNRPLARLALLFHAIKCGLDTVKKEAAERPSSKKADQERIAEGGPAEHVIAEKLTEEKAGQEDLFLSFKVIGPASSTTLKAMLEEADLKTNSQSYISQSFKDLSSVGAIEFYSPFATASARLLLNNSEASQTQRCPSEALKDKSQSAENPSAPTVSERAKGGEDDISTTGIGNDLQAGNERSMDELIDKFRKINVNFFRTIASDKDLARSILCEEFRRRDIEIKNTQDVVLLLAEWDTFYGRALPEGFNSILVAERRAELASRAANARTKENKFSATEERSEAERDCGHGYCACGVCRYSYLRGLDGNLPPTAGTKAKDPNAKPNSLSALLDSDALERPVGDSQLDYLRRLAHRIEREAGELTSGRVRAIGVLGSDVYDKLLILQALRPRFPKAMFFTTDLDSRYLEPSSFEWTRNLIVASGFGLELDAALQVDAPPFRDSYQTAAFYAARLAAGSGCPPQSEVPPQLFEIGRQEPIILGASGNNQLVSSGTCAQSIARRIKTGELGIFDPPADKPLHPPSAPELKQAEVDILTKAASVVLLAAVLSIVLIRPLRQRPWILLVGVCVLALPIVTVALLVMVDGQAGEPFSLQAGVSIWPAEAIRLFACLLSGSLLIYTVRALQINIDDLSENKYCLNATTEREPDGSSSLWRKCVLPVWSDKVIGHDTVNVQELWSMYVERYSAQRRFWRIPRFWRVVPVLCVYLGMILMFAIWEPVPARGWLSSFADRLILVSVTAAFASLLFYVIDETRMTEQFIEKLTAKPSEWPDPALRKFALLRGLVRDPVSAPEFKQWRENPQRTAALRDWLAIQLVADRTDAVIKPIYFPFTILLLLVVSYHPWFDRWIVSPVLILIFLLHASLAVGCTVTLRRAAEKGRRRALERMRQALSMAMCEKDKPRVDPIKLLIEEVEQIRKGALCPIAHQPILKAALLPFGGAGGLLALEYLITS